MSEAHSLISAIGQRILLPSPGRSPALAHLIASRPDRVAPLRLTFPTMGSNTTDPDTAIRIAKLSAELIATRADVNTERIRADNWRDAGNKYYDIREWLRLYDDDPNGHADFYTEVDEILFPNQGEPLTVPALQARVQRLQRTLADAQRQLAEAQQGGRS